MDSLRRLNGMLRGLIAILLLPAVGSGALFGKPFRNGFDLENASIPWKEIKNGGPARDGIPAIDFPEFLTVEETDYLKDSDLLMSVSHGSEIRAYPIRILNYHEIVNDTIEDLSFAVTYCPLCGTGMVFDREIEGEITTFGVSGLLYQSDVLLYDRATESLWSQLLMKAVSGIRLDCSLEWIPSEFMTWSAWKERYPQGRVLSRKTGHRRNYNRTPYPGYESSDAVFFPVPLYRKELGIKDRVMGIKLDGKATAYDLALFVSGRTYEDTIGDTTITINYDQEIRHAEVLDSYSGKSIPYVYAYWFAWQAFHPETRLLTARQKAVETVP